MHRAWEENLSPVPEQVYAADAAWLGFGGKPQRPNQDPAWPRIQDDDLQRLAARREPVDVLYSQHPERTCHATR